MAVMPRKMTRMIRLCLRLSIGYHTLGLLALAQKILEIFEDEVIGVMLEPPHTLPT
ncbi:MAG: hypothetical protein R2880_02685 [Deinococcales bacterium]